MPFVCSICEEESTRICVRCTKDACENHLCEKCGRCSDCCECELALDEHPNPSVGSARAVLSTAIPAATATSPEPDPEAEPEAPAPPPDPDPVPQEDPESGPVMP